MFCVILRLMVTVGERKHSKRIELCSEILRDRYVVMAGSISPPRVTRISVGVCSNWNRGHCCRFPWIMAALLLCCGDVESNPGPVRNPCTVCSKSVRFRQISRECHAIVVRCGLMRIVVGSTKKSIKGCSQWRSFRGSVHRAYLLSCLMLTMDSLMVLISHFSVSLTPLRPFHL